MNDEGSHHWHFLATHEAYVTIRCRAPRARPTPNMKRTFQMTATSRAALKAAAGLLALAGLTGCLQSEAGRPFANIASPIPSGFAQFCYSSLGLPYECFVAKVTAAKSTPTRIEYKEAHAKESKFLWIQTTALDGGRLIVHQIGDDAKAPKPPYQGAYGYATYYQGELSVNIPQCDEATLAPVFAALGASTTNMCGASFGTVGMLPASFTEQQLAGVMRAYAAFPDGRAIAGRVKLASMSQKMGEELWAPKKPTSK